MLCPGVLHVGTQLETGPLLDGVEDAAPDALDQGGEEI